MATIISAWDDYEIVQFYNASSDVYHVAREDKTLCGLKVSAAKGGVYSASAYGVELDKICLNCYKADGFWKDETIIEEVS